MQHPNPQRRSTRAGVLLSALGILLAASVPAEASETSDLGQLQQDLTVEYALVSEAGSVNKGAPTFRHQVELRAGGQCTFKINSGGGTSAIGDSLMEIFNSSNASVGFNDDYGSGTLSRIDINLPRGTYFVNVWANKSHVTATYLLEVNCTKPPVIFYQNFVGSPGADLWQCFRWAWEVIDAPFGEWTEAIHIDTDNRVGGCQQQFTISDPTNYLSGLNLSVKFTGEANQCLNQGTRQIPINGIPSAWSTPYTIDADNRAGGCWQEFTLTGRSDLALDVEFLATIPGDDQCGGAGNHTVRVGNTVSVFINTDSRAGACSQRFRLRNYYPGE
ncbi:hypothetical protein HUW62_38935 [Myxococcus sp. AM011]|uniref:hypothetical protein n=1 Tax=Myxococcus sp. AM011 TaxID=2745200 RepID=UPI001595F229|nr:hypothetical protein [Myxococcus sp. AM011]NVJ27208.1 hypothetical protein [Myxococcus sp. AM011]